MSQAYEVSEKISPDTALDANLDAGSASDYFALMKPRVMSLVIFTAWIGLVMAPGEMHPVMVFSALLMISLGAGASAALNMWYDADIDAIMTRTAKRPVPSGRVSKEGSLSFGLWMSGLSVFSLAVLVNYLSAALLAFTIFFYAVVYTMWLKRRTPQNIVIGGAAGALPPVIGWAAATNFLSIEPIIYFAIIFFWTPPHFWALSLLKNEEYKKVGVPMLSVTAGRAVTLNHILAYSFILSAIAMLPALLGYAGTTYAVAAGALNIGFLAFAIWLYVAKEATQDKASGWLFGYSIAYLFVLFACLPIDKYVSTLSSSGQ